MTKTNIEWADRVWNPVVGCSHSGMKGCDNCYAQVMAWRLRGMRKHPYWPPVDEPEVVGQQGWTGNVHLCYGRLDDPLKWKQPARIFVDSMSDLFHEKVPFAFIDQVFARMAVCPRHTFIVLTKRPRRMQEYVNWKFFTHADIDDVYTIIDDLGGDANVEVPFPNVWLLASASTQEEMEKAAEYLWQIPAVVRGFSLEPLLESMCDIPPFEWVIVGCESGPQRRMCLEHWVEGVQTQCRRNGTAVFIKQVMRDGKVFKLTEKNKADWPAWAVQEWPNED